MYDAAAAQAVVCDKASSLSLPFSEDCTCMHPYGIEYSMLVLNGVHDLARPVGLMHLGLCSNDHMALHGPLAPAKQWYESTAPLSFAS